MKDFRNHLFAALAGIICGVLLVVGASRCHRQQIETKVERDTVIVTDTTVHYYPKPVEVTKVRTEYRWLTRVEHSTDTLTRTDSVLVEVPIESKHYSSSEYDAWVSGYEPSLDSIKVYQRTQMITEIRTITLKDNKRFFLDVGGGCEYMVNDKSATPFAELGLKFKPGRWGIGVSGGYQHNGATNTGEPYARFKLSYDLISF